MSVAQPRGAWGQPIVRAPQAALGLGAPAPKAVRLPSDASDQEGIFEGLLWVVRGLEECGRAFTRLAGRLGKVEARLHELESAESPAPPPAAAVPVAPAPGPADLDQHLSSLEQDVVGVYRELDGVAQRVDDRMARAVAELAKPAESIERRLAALEARLERGGRPPPRAEMLAPSPAARPAAPPPPGPMPSELVRPALELLPEEARNRAASVLSAELDRIRLSLGALRAESPRTT